MKLCRRTQAIMLALRIGLGGVLVTAGWLKIAEPLAFEAAIASYALTPGSWHRPMAALLPWLEVVTGSLLVCGLWTRSSALVAAAMFACFVGAMGINLLRGADVDCGCFGGDGGRLPVWGALLRTVLLLGVAAAVSRQRGDPSLSVDRLLRRRAAGTSGTAVGVETGGTCAGVLDDVAGLG